MNIIARCKKCSKEFKTTQYRVVNGHGKYCSRECYIVCSNKDKIGNIGPLWKGEEAGYHAKHRWIDRVYGTPSVCEHCGSTTAKKYEWANISGMYIRSDRNDWARLCVPCHIKLDDRLNKSWVTRHNLVGAK